jgi:hypothetical protein
MAKPSTNKPHNNRSSGSEKQEAQQESNPVTSLRKTFRSYASTLTLAARSAEKLLAKKANPSDVATTELDPKIREDLKNSVKMTLKMKQALREQTALIEGNLRGNAKESEALHCMLRSQPCAGGKKRKFSIVTDEESLRG